MSQKGAIAVFILIGALIIAGLGGAFYLRKTMSSKASPGAADISQNPVVTSANLPKTPVQVSTPEPSADPTANWESYQSSCGLSVKYPQGFNATKFFTQDSESSCAYLTAPDYKFQLDSRTGFYVSLSRIAKGTKAHGVGITINSLDDLVTSLESIVTPSGKISTQETTYGSYSGIVFSPPGVDSQTEFAFENGNYIYEVTWPAPAQYKGNYSDNIELIISSIKFTH